MEIAVQVSNRQTYVTYALKYETTSHYLMASLVVDPYQSAPFFAWNMSRTADCTPYSDVVNGRICPRTESC